MPDKKQTGNVTCPRCGTLLTTADRISKSTLQLLFAPHSRRYHCDSCGLKFKVSPPSAQATSEPVPDYELPPLRVDALADISVGSRKEPTTSQGRNSDGNTRRPRTTQLHVSEVPDIPGITNSAEKAALKRMAKKNKELQQELERLRQIEKKYRQLKKANHFLAKATTQQRG